AALGSLTSVFANVAPNPHGGCEGDSGGPLFASINGAAPTIIGVMSVINSNCAADSSYSRVDVDLAWVEATIRQYDPAGAPADGGVRPPLPDATPAGDRPPGPPDAARVVDTAGTSGGGGMGSAGAAGGAGG